MPQMSPLQWEFLFFMLLIHIMMLMSKLFFLSFSDMLNLVEIKNQKATNRLNWLW